MTGLGLLLLLLAAPPAAPPPFQNTASVPLVALVSGETRRVRLEPGASWAVAAPAGRFALQDWAQALERDLRPELAQFHLRTAGRLLDAVDPGDEGNPASAANLRLLASVDAKQAESWARPPALRLALAAQAAAHVSPGPLLERLLVEAQPTADEPWPKAWELPPLSALVAAAVERAGPAALPILLKHPEWAQALGFGPTGLASVFEVGPKPTGGESGAVRAALDAGDGSAAARLALGGPPGRDRLRCAALDLGAQAALKRGHTLAAEAWALHAAPRCGPSEASTSRAAAVLRQRGERAFKRGDLVTAAGVFRAAWWLGESPSDRGRLADTEASLALLHFARKRFEQGQARLAAAKAVDPLRARVQEALRASPEPDMRARAGMIFIILLLGYFALRRLGRVLKKP